MECPSCGSENRDEARFCDSCGAALAESPAPETKAPEQSGGVTPPPPGSPTEIVGRYKVNGFLGQGGRKRVYLAQDAEADNREVAVAVFDTEGATAAIGARARREAKAMGKLAGHPHVVGVYDTGEEGGDPFIVSEYMAGGDVEGMLDAEPDRRLEVPRVIEIGIDVTKALEHAHGRGIVHRDIKPANIWLAEDGSARLGDFGLATTEGRSRVSESGSLVGTVAYLPPEQALGQASGPRSDLYSLGALLYEMLTGQPPFVGDDAVAVISQHINSEPVPPSRHNRAVSRVLDELVLDLLAKRPDDRPANAAEARQRLSAAAGAPPVAEEGVEDAANPLDELAGGIFVGREKEIEQLRGELGEALGGSGRVVLLVGEPGIGKTRTTEELTTYAQVRGARVLWGRCREDEGAPAYWPWVQAIRTYVREADPIALAWQAGGGAADVAQLVPELAERMTVPEVPELDGEEARFRLFDSVTSFLTAASRDRPLVIVLDDLHWADEPSLRLLEFAARELSGANLLIVGTYRDVELGRHHPLAGVLSELGGMEATRRVTLRGLDCPAVARYIEMATGVAPPKDLEEAVHEQTEGNPFFVSEVVRLLASEGNLREVESAVAGGSWELAIPQGVREVVGRRLDRLSEDTNQVLRAAAAIGREFDGEVVQRVADLSPERLGAAAEEAAAARLVIPTGQPGRYSFDHALVRETLHDELSSNQHARLHADIAAAIEDLHGDDPERIGELAHHYLSAGTAGDPAKAVDFAIEASNRAMKQLAYEEAAELLAKACDVYEMVEDPSQERRLELLMALGEARTASGLFPPARESLEAAVQVARELDDTEAFARAVVGISRLTVVGVADQEIISLAEEALEKVGKEDSALRSALLRALAAEMLWIDAEGRARELAEESLQMARRVGDPESLCAGLHARIITALAAGTSEERVAYIDEMAEVAEREGELEYLLRAHAFRLRENLELGNIDVVDREIDSYEAVARQLRMPAHLWHVPLFRAMRAVMKGELDEAERFGIESVTGGKRAGEPLAEQFFGVLLGQIRRLQGRVDELLPVMEQMVERFPAIPAWRTVYAASLAQLGRVEEAKVEFERLASNEFEDIPHDAQYRGALALLAEVCVAVGDSLRAEFLYGELLEASDRVLVVGRAAMAAGPFARHLGLLAGTLGREEEAEEHFRRAIEITERIGDRPMGAWTRIDYASVLLGVIQAAADRETDVSDADRERAIQLLGEAIEIARQVRAAGLVERGLGLRLAAQGLSEVDITTSIDDVISAVESEQPDLRAHAAPDGTVTILFSDIEDSTLHTERLGDERWLELLRAHNTIFREQISKHGGYEVKNQGDGFMLAFPDPREALECAIEVQRAFAARAAEDAEDALRIRMGLHAGEVIHEEGDFFGKNVILAARIAAKAMGGEILVSSSLKDAASTDDEGEDGLRFDGGRELELKGLAGSHRVFRADWEPQEATA